jgi:hypothetical protein
VETYKAQIENELASCSNQILFLLVNILIPNSGNDQDEAEAKVFYLKMTGDYYRYLAESVSKNQSANANLAKDYYEKVCSFLYFEIFFVCDVQYLQLLPPCTGLRHCRQDLGTYPPCSPWPRIELLRVLL